MTTYQFDPVAHGAPIIYFNGNSNILNKVFGGADPSKILSFFLGGLKDFQTSRGGKLRKVAFDFSGSFYQQQKAGGFGSVGRQKNPCDIGMKQPSNMSNISGENISFSQARQWAKNSLEPFTFFLGQMNGGHRFDVIQQGSQWEDFNNFWYGVAASESGLPFNSLLRVSGVGSFIDNKQGYARYGTYPVSVNSELDALIAYSQATTGIIPRGTGFMYDDPVDAFWMRRGWEYAQSNCK